MEQVEEEDDDFNDTQVLIKEPEFFGMLINSESQKYLNMRNLHFDQIKNKESRRQSSHLPRKEN